MDKVIIFNQSLHQISYIARTTTKGEEYDMVKINLHILLTIWKIMLNSSLANLINLYTQQFVYIQKQLETIRLLNFWLNTSAHYQ